MLLEQVEDLVILFFGRGHGSTLSAFSILCSKIKALLKQHNLNNGE